MVEAVKRRRLHNSLFQLTSGLATSPPTTRRIKVQHKFSVFLQHSQFGLSSQFVTIPAISKLQSSLKFPSIFELTFAGRLPTGQWSLAPSLIPHPSPHLFPFDSYSLFCLFTTLFGRWHSLGAVTIPFIALIAIHLGSPHNLLSQTPRCQAPHASVKLISRAHLTALTLASPLAVFTQAERQTLQNSASMADLDAELLALAGGDESSADERSPSPRPKSPSPQQHNLQRRSSSPADMGRKGTAKVIQKPRRRRADSDDDGEL